MITQEELDIMVFEAQANVHEIMKEITEEEVEDDGEDETYG